MFSDLKPGTKYVFCVRCVCVSGLGHEKVGPWCDAVEFTTSPTPVAQNVRCTSVGMCEASIEWDPAPVEMVWELEVARKEPSGAFSVFNKVYEGTLRLCAIKDLKMGTEYVARVRGKVGDGKWGEWGSELNFETKKWACSWMQCPGNRYSVSGKLNNIATNLEGWSSIVGDTPIPIGATVSWKVDLRCDIGCDYPEVGITTADRRYSAYINCSRSSIRSGSSTYDPFSKFELEVDRKLKYDYLLRLIIRRNAESPIGVVVDTEKREVSFVVEGVIFGTVPNIPLDKPLVPYVSLGYKGDSAELVVQ